ncbi:unnamed protein product, partial [Meganyctiphanes norvegica]
MQVDVNAIKIKKKMMKPVSDGIRPIRPSMQLRRTEAVWMGSPAACSSAAAPTDHTVNPFIEELLTMHNTLDVRRRIHHLQPRATPVFMASQKNHLAVVQALVAANADVNIAATGGSVKGY